MRMGIRLGVYLKKGSDWGRVSTAKDLKMCVNNYGIGDAMYWSLKAVVSNRIKFWT
jgi:hypothetical protein